MAMRIIALCLGLVLSLCSWSSRAEEALCAEVKIEILQELTMERQGFEAMMRITNSLDTFSLENVSVKVFFKDADGNPVVATSNTSASNAAFFIRKDDSQDVSNLQEGADGYLHGGTIAPKKVGELRWLIIPTANAAGQTKDGKLFFVGAELRYSYGGKEEVVTVADDSIVVKPQPVLTLDYFLTEEVVGDNGFTQEIEPAEPYTLGVRINNNGFGTAKSVKIESAQPKITENKLGLAVNFKILGSYLKDQPSTPSLLINFGNIEPKGITTGRWIMESNLAGKFIAFNASFTHADELGGDLTSLLQATNANFLVRDVVMDLPGRDNLRDFLAYDKTRILHVFESEPTGANEVACSNCKKVTEIANATLTAINGARSKIEFTPVGGLTYAAATDPFDGNKLLAKVVREDGSVVHPQNAWLSKKRASDKVNFNYFVNVFDNNSSGKYTVYWGGNLVDVPQPPVIQFVMDQVTYEGGNIGFIVRATDPNTTLPNLSALQLPVGASFINGAVNEGIFNWSPLPGQAGQYAITFIATDGELTAERVVNIRVNPSHDTDGDGMDDDWEREKFGNLDKDGTADSDGDGRSDLQEFEEGTDPNLVDAVPATPQILSPVYNADTLNGASLPLQPELIVTNGNHAEEVGPVAILFEVYKDEALTEFMGSTTIAEGTGATNNSNTTRWKISPADLVEGMEFEDNTLYYWRAKSVQTGTASASSVWVKSRFFINVANDLPTQPQISSPAIDASIVDVSPTLVITNSADIDRDELRYGFELFAESNLENPVASVSGLFAGNNGQTSWFVASILQEDQRYVWQASVTDEHNAVVKSEWGSFFVNTQNHAPTNPQIDAPQSASTVEELGQDASVMLRVINSTDPERKPVKYYFELDTVNTFDSANKKISPLVNAGSAHTEWKVTGLTEDSHYFWRVKATDGEAESAWVVSDFTVSHVNQAPGIPVLQNPVDGAVIATSSVTLEANPAIDPEGDTVKYHIQLFSDAALTQSLVNETTTMPTWQYGPLIDKATYYWRMRAEDAEGKLSDWSEIETFTINLPPVNVAPQLSFILPSQNVTQNTGNLLIQWQDTDPDSAATISLKLKKISASPVEWITVAQNISEDLDESSDTYYLNVANLAAGTYRIVAEITDVQSLVTVESCCTLTVLPPVSNTPTSFWQFNEGSGQTTYSTNAISAPVKVSTVFQNPNAQPAAWVASANAQAGTALQFDGLGAYVELPKSATQPLLGEATLSFWFKGTKLGGKAEDSIAIIGSHYNGTNNHIKWGSVGFKGQFGIAVGSARLLGMTPVANGSWHHVVISRSLVSGSNNGMARIYVDGNLDAQAIPVDSSFNGMINTFAGMVHNRFAATNQGGINNTTKFINGAVDNLRIYDRALTAQDVVAIYTEEMGAAPLAPNEYQLANSNNIYQAEAASIYLGQPLADYANFTGLGFADYDNISGSYVEWLVESNIEKTVSLKVRYANGGATDRPVKLHVNDELKNPAISFISTGNWSIWKFVTVTATLKPGLNKVRLTANLETGGPNIDYLEVIE
ncbi:MAG: hypothetical protein B0W54_15170 [Cellvibrio sp. 79]|nr:MAG: hypothetical protein B0W54_15170 [Cellvibrio sp. 79]